MLKIQLDLPTYQFVEADIPTPLIVHLIQRLQTETIEEVLDLKEET